MFHPPFEICRELFIRLKKLQRAESVLQLLLREVCMDGSMAHVADEDVVPILFLNGLVLVSALALRDEMVFLKRPLEAAQLAFVHFVSSV